MTMRGIGYFNAPLLDDTITVLKQSSALRHVSIVMPYDIVSAQSDGLQWVNYVQGTPVLDLGGFHGLHTLSITHLSYADPTALISQLASTLYGSPNLESLKLDICLDYNPWQFPGRLASAYQQAGGQPLPIRDLKLGNGCDIVNNGTPCSELSMICATGRLHRFKAHQYSTLGLSHGLAGLPAYLRSIQRLSIWELDNNVMRFIREIGDDRSLSPKFMSELCFKRCHFSSRFLDLMDFHSEKYRVWPTLLSIKSFQPASGTGVASGVPDVRRKIIKRLGYWKGLCKLNLPVNLAIAKDRVSWYSTFI